MKEITISLEDKTFYFIDEFLKAPDCPWIDASDFVQDCVDKALKDMLVKAVSIMANLADMKDESEDD